jgi:hypothetical protein
MFSKSLWPTLICGEPNFIQCPFVSDFLHACFDIQVNKYFFALPLYHGGQKTKKSCHRKFVVRVYTRAIDKELARLQPN